MMASEKAGRRAGMESARRILYVQYTNPAGYPPLEHSSRILADQGWTVRLLGTGALGAGALHFPPHPRIHVHLLPFQAAGWRQKLHYLRYCAWVLITAMRWRPAWVYASDPLASLPALLLQRLPGVRVLYHEHDSPSITGANGFQRLVVAARRRLGKTAELCVLPNEERAARFRAETGAPATYCVWNCPRRDEVGTARPTMIGDALRVLYHGSLVPDRLPLHIADALALLPPAVTLHAVGYETIGSAGHAAQLRDQAARLGLGDRVSVGAAQSRSALIPFSRTFDVGLALMPARSDDPNFSAMVGASNKLFDYLASGMAVLVSNLPSWGVAYVEPGYGLACNPASPASIAEALGWYLAHKNELRAMGERGRQRILSEWNYETQFAPVLRRISER